MDFFHTTVSNSALAKVTEVLKSGFLNEGSVVKNFETDLGAYLKAPHVVTTNSATAALFLCLRHLGVGPGDEVILPAQTFIATGLVILHAGATPVFADIDAETGNISAASIRAKITERTKAIMPVHWGGEPCDMDAIGAVANEHGLPVIEDAAHAFGAEYRGRMVGSISRFTCFSFQAIKAMTTGDGGAISLTSDEDIDGLLRLRWFGMKKGEAPVTEIGERSIDVHVAGYKYHMNNVAAALGVGNLEGYPERLARRRAIAERYNTALDQIPGLRLRRMDPESRSACWLYTLLVDERVNFCRAMKARDVPVTIVDRRIDKHPVFGGGPRAGLTGTEIFDRDQIHIPIHEALSDADVEQVITAIKAGW
jgi:perosamine synthetase